jgi:ketosteroid isomerase-like protein
MSQQDIEFVKRGFEAMSRGVDEAIELIDPEFEMVTTADYAAEPDTYRGREGVRRWFAGWDGAMDEIRLAPRTLEDAGEGRVIVEFTLSARGIRTGLEAGQEAVAMVTLRGELLRRIDFFPDLDAARAAAA